ncbi:MAG TPA: hypothetical protein VIL30_05945 [Ramlibacter sp.]|jgi:hypothetical protein
MHSLDILMPAPETEMTPAARRAARKRASAERARRHREKIAQEGLPTARDIDLALSEALAFVSRRAVVVNGRPLIDLGDVISTAGLILKRGGKKKGGSLAAVRDRIAHRSDHERPIWVPSTNPKQPTLLLPPEGGGQWTDQDIRDLKSVMDRHIAHRTPSQP